MGDIKDEILEHVAGTLLSRDVEADIARLDIQAQYVQMDRVEMEMQNLRTVAARRGRQGQWNHDRVHPHLPDGCDLRSLIDDEVEMNGNDAGSQLPQKSIR